MGAVMKTLLDILARAAMLVESILVCLGAVFR